MNSVLMEIFERRVRKGHGYFGYHRVTTQNSFEICDQDGVAKLVATG